MNKKEKTDKKNVEQDILSKVTNNNYFYIIALLLLSFLIYFSRFHKPEGLFWDENYHIASAQKYIDGVFFFEPHPPLGKMLIALGEVIINPNKNLDRSSFLDTDYVKGEMLPAGFKFYGFRFASTFLGALSVVLFFLLLYSLVNNYYYAFLFSFLYLFDNAILVHSRSAMLEGIQFFFIIVTLLYFANLIRKKESYKPRDYFILSIFIGLATMVKVNSLILVLLAVFLFFIEHFKDILSLKIFNFNLIKETLLKVFVFLSGIFLVAFLVFYVHFNITRKVVANRYYEITSREVKYIIDKQKFLNPFNNLKLMAEYVKFMHKYEKGVPKYDPTKPGENGSLPYHWLVGKKAINYRWEKKDNKVAYVYLQSNPIIWGIGLISIISSILMVLVTTLFRLKIKNFNIFRSIIFFLILYISYMAAMMRIHRVMYLYHYFIPLIFTFVLFYLLINYFFEDKIKKDNTVFTLSIMAIFILVVLAFFFYSPFTYFIPISTKEFMLRVWFKFWGLNPVS